MPVGRDDSADFDAVPMISKAQVKALAAGESWLENSDNLLCFGPPVAPNRVPLRFRLGFVSARSPT
jgi:hypothetical protein